MGMHAWGGQNMAWACCRLLGCWDQGGWWGPGGRRGPDAALSMDALTYSRAGCIATRIEMQQEDFSRQFMDCRAPHCSPPLLMLPPLPMLLPLPMCLLLLLMLPLLMPLPLSMLLLLLLPCAG